MSDETTTPTPVAEPVVETPVEETAPAAEPTEVAA